MSPFSRPDLLRCFVAMLIAVSLAGPLRAQESPAPLVFGEVVEIESRVLGENRTLWVSTPASYEDSGARYPVLYLLDGDTHLPHVSALIRYFARYNRMPEMIVVGVLNTNRTRDFTPRSAEQSPDETSRTGGADRFAEFLSDEVRAHIEGSYRTQPFSILAGHSLGGLFAVHEWLTEGDGFDAHIAISPSLYWDDSASVKAVRTALQESEEGPQGYLFVGLGEFERPPILASTRALVAALETGAPGSLRWTFRDFPGENHLTVPYPALHRALRDLFDGWGLPYERTVARVVAEEELAAFDDHFAALSERFGFPVDPPEIMFSMVGDALFRQDKLDLAIELFQRRVETYPTSPEAHDELGRGHEQLEQWRLALQSYERALELASAQGHPSLREIEARRDGVRARLR